MLLGSVELRFFESRRNNGIQCNEMLIAFNWQIIQIFLNIIETKAESIRGSNWACENVTAEVNNKQQTEHCLWFVKKHFALTLWSFSYTSLFLSISDYHCLFSFICRNLLSRHSLSFSLPSIVRISISVSTTALCRTAFESPGRTLPSKHIRLTTGS